MFSTLSRSRNALRKPFEQRLSRWIKKRQGKDSAPFTLRSKRLYILPTRVGITLAFVCFAMLLGAMNYNNSMGFALTFMVAATGLISMHRCHQNLAGITVVRVHSTSVFAGETAQLDLTLHNPSASPRFDVVGKLNRHTSASIDIPPDTSRAVRLNMPTQTRGVLRIERIGLQTTFPLMLLHTWAWLYMDCEILVWPKPADNAPPLPSTASNEAGENGTGGDDEFAGLREYQPGDSPRKIAWKAYARSDTMMSRHFSGSNASRAWIDDAALSNVDTETALGIMARWVLDAASSGDDYGLRVGGSEIAPGRGSAHRNRCLDALARVPTGVSSHA